MTNTTRIEYHPDRPIVHFGSAVGTSFWRPKSEEKQSKSKKKGKK